MKTTKQNFLSCDKKTAINSYGVLFEVGEVVKHQDKEAGTAKIISFFEDIARNEIAAQTTKGVAHIDFIEQQ